MIAANAAQAFDQLTPPSCLWLACAANAMTASALCSLARRQVLLVRLSSCNIAACWAAALCESYVMPQSHKAPS